MTETDQFAEALDLLRRIDRHEGTKEEYFQLMIDIQQFLKKVDEDI